MRKRAQKRKTGTVTMRAATVPSPGGPQAFSLADVPEPSAGPGDTVMRITAAGVNYADILQRGGHYPPPPDAPAWPGLEVAGFVESAPLAAADASPQSARTWHPAPGDPVCALLPGGGYAQRVAVDSRLVLPVPPGLTPIEAAALVEAAATVMSNLDAVAAAPGETILIHGGSGGVGTVAIQIARALGLRVVATAGSASRAGRCLDLGAVAAFDYRTQDWVAGVAALGGADVILDVAGAAYLASNVAALRRGGRLAILGLRKGVRGELDLGEVLAKGATLYGATLRARPLEERATIVARVHEVVWPLVPDLVRPIVHATFPLEQVAQAHELLESGEVFGKVVLTVD